VTIATILPLIIFPSIISLGLPEKIKIAFYRNLRPHPNGLRDKNQAAVE
jgi:hypothetical protein